MARQYEGDVKESDFIIDSVIANGIRGVLKGADPFCTIRVLNMKGAGSASIKMNSPPFNVLWVVFFSYILSACAVKESPEDQVRRFVGAGVMAAELREALTIRDLISEDYRDDGGRDKRNLVGLAAGYFLRHKNINLFTKINEISFPIAGQSRVEVFVAMTGLPVTGSEALIDLRADAYRFELTLINKGNEWLLKKSSWQRASIDDLLD